MGAHMPGARGLLVVRCTGKLEEVCPTGTLAIGGSRYNVSPPTSASLSSLSALVSASLALVPIYSSPIRDAVDAAHRMEQSLQALQPIAAPGLRDPDGYLTLWTLRVVLLVQMRALNSDFH